MESPEQLRAWRARWVEVNDATDSERRPGDAGDRLRILDRLYLASFSTNSRRIDDGEAVWRRLQALRRAYRGDA